jgi:hypothetical protein
MKDVGEKIRAGRLAHLEGELAFWERRGWMPVVRVSHWKLTGCVDRSTHVHAHRFTTLPSYLSLSKRWGRPWGLVTGVRGTRLTGRRKWRKRMVR